MPLPPPPQSNYAQDLSETINAHWDQPVPTSEGMIFGDSYAGFAMRMNRQYLPGELTRFTGGISPLHIYDAVTTGDWDLIIDDAIITLGSIASDYLNDTFYNTSNRDYLNRKHLASEESVVQDLYGAENGWRYNHKLEDRGYLSFYHPEQAYGETLLAPRNSHKVGDLDTFRLPFFENPKISESRSAVYANHTLVNQNEPYRLWTNSKPLSLDVTFSITLPHLIQFAQDHMRTTYSYVMKGEDFKTELFKSIQKVADITKNLPEGVEVEDFNKDLLSNSSEFLFDYSIDRYGVTAKILEGMLLEVNQPDSHSNVRHHLITYVMYLINLIKSSVIGSSNITNSQEYRDDLSRRADASKSYNESVQAERDADMEYQEYLDPYDFTDPAETSLWLEDVPTVPTGGLTTKYIPPPIIFLTYGGIYDNDPFIATKYSIEFDGKEGYDELSLIPRHIKIKLTLESSERHSQSVPNRGLSKLFRSPYSG